MWSSGPCDGVSARSPWGIPEPVRHLVIMPDGSNWRLWCSGSLARREENQQSGRFCRRCRRLAADAIADGTLDERTVSGWL